MRSRALAVLPLLVSAGCASSGTAVPPPRSVLATRAPQTRSYEAADRRAVMSALAQGLQDAGFQLAQVDFDAGFVSANAERLEGKQASALVRTLFWYPYLIPFRGLLAKKRHVVIEATGTVVDEGAAHRVRIVCRTRVLETSGKMQALEEVEDPQFYQELFARIDKALFLVRQRF